MRPWRVSKGCAWASEQSARAAPKPSSSDLEALFGISLAHAAPKVGPRPRTEASRLKTRRLGGFDTVTLTLRNFQYLYQFKTILENH